MSKRKFLIFMSLAMAVVVLSWGVDQGWAQSTNNNKELKYRGGKITPAERKAAAQRAKDLGLLPGAAALGIPAPGDIDGPGGIPHYFGPYGNWAYSPLPRGPITSVTVVNGGTLYSNTPTVTIVDAYGTGSGASATVKVSKGVITSITIKAGAGGTNYTAPIVTITDPTGTGATATASIATVPIGGTLTGGMRKFVDKMPGLGPANANLLGQYIPVAAKEPVGQETYSGSDYYEIALVEYREKMHSDLLLPTRLRGYVQLSTSKVPGASLPLTNPNGTPIMMPDGVTQAIAVDKPHYLGPTIVANGDRPVRIKFYNLLPTGSGGDLFIPVDKTVPGSGFGPGISSDLYTENRAAVHLHGNNTVWISDGTPHQWITPANETTPYPKGVSVYNVPDMPNPGKPPVPPAVDPAAGTLTIYYTNAMSARLMFYHDHAYGITRLNVYAGEAAGYVITDRVDQDMINGTNNTGVNPGNLKVLPDLGIPLVIQDRTFVDASTILAQDPTWNWGTGTRDLNTGIMSSFNTGDLWYPHVYMTVQNPWDLTGTNAFGRWHYGPWFNPPTPTCTAPDVPAGCIEVGPVNNPFYQPICDTNPADPACTAAWEPPLMPGNPNPSIPGEAFQDTPIVNGTAYPYLVVEPKAYRFRILNAGNDRFLNLQLYVAADKTTPTTAGTTGAKLCDKATAPYGNCTEVKMVPVSVAPANQYADTPSGIPDPATKGPDWIQIGTEGGFLPAPVVIPSQPVGFNLNPAFFNFGVVNQKSLFLGTAERADVVVDFSAYAGKTLILYNDAPAPVPAGAPPYDYYTGAADQVDAGGPPTPQPGYGPNTRTIMQIRVGTTVTTPTPQVTLANLNAVFAKGVNPDGTPNPAKLGVFEVSQDPIIIPQAAYNSAYNNTFPATAAAQYVQIGDIEKTFSPIDKNNVSGPLLPPVTLPLQMKGMHDEMGGVYDTQFGRMSGMLGLTNPLRGNAFIIPYGYASPPTDIHLGSLSTDQIGSFPDGTQIWRIFHNGVDTHPIHVHLFNAQLINRLGQDGALLPPDPNELGWKDTFRVNPLEITYIAMRPVIPTPAQVPFEVPNSVRLIDPTLPAGVPLIPPPPAGWFDPLGNAITQILNHEVNFGWEYVWHCHILAHEEMDMMHSLVFAVPPWAPTINNATAVGTAVTLNWTDNSLNEQNFTVQRATDSNFMAGLTTIATNVVNSNPTGSMTSSDTVPATDTKYWYRVIANNLVGDFATANFPTMLASSFSNAVPVTVGTLPTPPSDPTFVSATLQPGPQVILTWTDNSTDETGFVVERCTVVPPAITCSNFAQIAAPVSPIPPNTTGNVTYPDTTVTAGNTYLYQVKAVNAGGSSAYVPSPPVTVPVPPAPAAPTGVTVSAVKVNSTTDTVTLKWAWTGSNLTDFTIQRATDATFTTGLVNIPRAATDRSYSYSEGRRLKLYYRIRANGPGGSSAWVLASPFPITTP